MDAFGLLVVIIIVLIIIALLIWFYIVARADYVKNNGDSDKYNWPYYAKKPLSQPEQVLYFRLRDALPEHIVLSQVQLSRILGVKGNNYQAWMNKINRMSVDFLILKKDATVVAAIELDDKTHTRADRVKADFKKDKALSSASIKIIRWNVNSLPDKDTIKTALGLDKDVELISNNS